MQVVILWQLSSFQLCVDRLGESPTKKRELGIMFEDLRVVGLGATTAYQPTIGSVLNPFVAFDNLIKARHPPVRDILTGFSGVVRTGEMLREFS